MAAATRDRDHLARAKPQRAFLELDLKAPLDHQKNLVAIGMRVPSIWLRHHADPHDVIVDPGNLAIVIRRAG